MLGSVPARMPDRNNNLTIGFEVRYGSRGQSYVFAEADSGGWTAYVTKGRGRQELPKATSLHHDTVRVTVPLSVFSDARELRWSVESSWLSSRMTGTSYAFDAAPDRGHTTFRRDR